MDGQTIVTIVVSVIGIIGSMAKLLHSLNTSIQVKFESMGKDISEKIEDLTREMSEIRENMAERNAVVKYLEQRIDKLEKKAETIEANCNSCHTKPKK